MTTFHYNGTEDGRCLHYDPVEGQCPNQAIPGGSWCYEHGSRP